MSIPSSVYKINNGNIFRKSICMCPYTPKGDKSYTIDGNSLTMQTACYHPRPEKNQIIFVSDGQRVS